jgi:hypothetical protein
MARLLLSPERAQSVGFASIVVTQLAQTLDAGRATGGISRATTAAVASTVAVLAAALHVRPLGAFLGLTSPGTLGWLLIAASGAAAPAVARAWSRKDLAVSQAGSQSDAAARDGVPRQQKRIAHVLG